METPVRLLPTKLAARYCGIPASRFAKVCPARPVRITEQERPKWDIKDLDSWIDSVKSGGETKTKEEWLEKL